MDYLAHSEHHPDRHYVLETDHVQDQNGGQANEIGDLLQRTDEIHKKLARQKAQAEEDQHDQLMEREKQEKKRQQREKRHNER